MPNVREFVFDSADPKDPKFVDPVYTPFKTVCSDYCYSVWTAILNWSVVVVYYGAVGQGTVMW